LDLDQGRHREAALQVLVALDATLAELAADPTAAALADRLEELRGQRDAIAAAAQTALGAPLSAAEREAVTFTLSRIEAAFRARAVANA
jgi:cell division protein FtsB